MSAECRYAVAPKECYRGTGGDTMKRVANPDRFLCSWANFHPDAPAKLVDTPPWLQNNAMAGHLMRKGDCDKCPCFDRGEPVE